MAGIIEPAELKLRIRQQWAMHYLLEAFKAGKQRVVLVMPTGSGKRYCAVWLCQYATRANKRVLFVTNRRLLVQQMVKEAMEFGVNHGTYMASLAPGDLNANIQIASLHTLRSWYIKGKGAKAGTELPKADLIIIDEGHNDVELYKELWAFYPDAKVVALTATPVGGSGRPLQPPYEMIIEGSKNTQHIDDGDLLPTLVYAPSEPDIKGVKITKKEEFNQNQLSRVVKECTVFADVFKDWAPFANRKTVCFVPGVAYGHDIVKQFNSYLGGGQAWMISGATSQEERERIFGLIRSGQAKVLVSVDILREGFDLPELSCGIDLQPNAQLRTYWQKLGRVKRAFPGQTEAIWLDFAGNYWKFPHPDSDPVWPVGDETTQDVIKKQRKTGEAPQPIMCPKCSTVRPGGPKCPECGLEPKGEPIRRVRMGNGKLKEVPAKAKVKKDKSIAERRIDRWRQMLFAGLAGKWSFAQCYIRYHKKHKEHPPFVPGTMWEHRDVHWKDKVNEVMTPAKIMRACDVAVVALGAK